MRLVLLSFILAFSLTAFGQSRHGHGHGGGHHPARHGHHGRVVVKHSHYRPATVVVYHPYWRPAYTYHRRWVYFPGRNMYWDNWRNHYVFYHGGVWISQPKPPSGIKEKDLENEKTRELREEEDDVDDVYKSNEKHKTE